MDLVYGVFYILKWSEKYGESRNLIGSYIGSQLSPLSEMLCDSISEDVFVLVWPYKISRERH